MVANTTKTTTINDAALNAFRLRIKGDVLIEGSEGYDQTRELRNALIDKRPAVIVRARDAADVSRSIHFARQQGLEIAVRSGGHSFPGYSMVDAGLVIDLKGMNELRIDAAAKIAWAQPGVRTGDFAEQAQKHGLAVPFGDAGSVGVGGITLGGGIGFLVRQHGLSIDHLTGVELVTADGTIIHASATEHAELFWALRGGGGNFGVVTGFEFELVEVGAVFGGVLVLPATPEVLAGYAKVSREAPESLTTISMVLKAPPLPFIPEESLGAPVLVVFTVSGGEMAEAEAAVAPLRALAEPVADLLAPMPYAGIYEYMRWAEERGREKIRSGFFPALSEDMIAALLGQVETAPGLGVFQIRPLGGEMARVDAGATAFSHRGANFMITAIGAWWEEEGDDANRAWVDTAWEAIKSTREGVYSNFLEDEEARIREAYASRTFDRLAGVKADYDPANVFHWNQNIRPRAVAIAA